MNYKLAVYNNILFILCSRGKNDFIGCQWEILPCTNNFKCSINLSDRVSSDVILKLKSNDLAWALQNLQSSNLISRLIANTIITNNLNDSSDCIL